jgi:hypothetical protein
MKEMALLFIHDSLKGTLKSRPTMYNFKTGLPDFFGSRMRLNGNILKYLATLLTYH